jgi:hypothetical protein
MVLRSSLSFTIASLIFSTSNSKFSILTTLSEIAFVKDPSKDVIVSFISVTSFCN